MPEGDTLHTLASFFAEAWVGQAPTSVRTRRGAIPDLVNQVIVAVTSKGKHLLIESASGTLLRVHLGLYGSWHGYRVGEPWAKPARQASLVIRLGGRDYVCFNAKEVEVLSGTGFPCRDRLVRLGPDLTRGSPSADQLQSRALALLGPETEVTDLLLDQRIASGIGNVYKSEVLFVQQCAPRTRLGDLSPEAFAGLYRRAGELLRSNLGGGPRITRRPDDGRGILWVYGRMGRPCFRCGTAVARARLGARPRSTYWCPGCQA